MQFLVGVVVGIIISTVGISGVASVLERGVEAIKQTSSQYVK